jgi:hypothetical protein
VKALKMFLRKLIAQPDGNRLLLCRIARQLAPAIVEQRDNYARRRCTTFSAGVVLCSALLGQSPLLSALFANAAIDKMHKAVLNLIPTE